MNFRLRPFVLICSLATSGSALGETPPDTGSAPRQFEEELVITGSHVPRKDLTSAGPVIVYGRDEIAKSGVATLGEFLRLTPWQGGGLNGNFDGAADGSTQVSLRNLGPRRTLVLVDGQRWVNGGVGAGSGFTVGVDLNTIPNAAVERVEILKDGASAVYGSDAIAGVVNIITKRRMNGVALDAYSGISSHGDAFQVQVSGTAGLSSDRGGFLVSLGYLHQAPVLTADRSWSERQISYNFATRRVDPSGTNVVPAGTFRVDPSTCPTQLCQGLKDAYGAGSADWIPDGNAALGVPVVTDPVTGQKWRKFIPSGPVNDLYNPNSREAMTYLITASDRLSLFTNGDYRLGDFARARLQTSWVHSESTSQLASELLFTSFVGQSYDPTNPYNPFGVPVSAMRRLVEFGPRDAQPNLNTVRVTGGLDGTVEGTFWSLSAAFGRTSTNTYEIGTQDLSKAATAIGPAHQDANGVWQCGRPGETIPGCTPANLVGVGSITPEMAQALGQYNGRAYGWSQLVVVDAQANRDLFTLAADRPVGVAAGYEFQRESGGFQPNAIAAAGHSFDFAGQPLKGSYRVHEVYLELLLPIVSDVPFADDIEVQAGGRWSQYSTWGARFTYVLGARWRPVRGLTLRGTWSTAFRAPQIDDLFSGQVNTIERATDPCAPTNLDSNPTLRAQCAAGPGGARAVGNGDTANNLYPSTTGGNPALRPETATTGTLGAVIEPPQIKGLSLTADYYHVKLEDAFTTALTASLIVAGCYPASVGSSVSPDPKDCSLITRDPETGRIQHFLDVEQNAGSLITNGIDVVLRYALPTAVGRFRFWLDSNYLITQNLVLPSGKVIHSAGNYDLNVFNATPGVTPRIRFNTGIDYDRGPFTTGVVARYIGGFDECAPPSGSTSGGHGLCTDHNVDPNTGAPYPIHRVSSYTAFDFYAGYVLRSSIGTTSFTVGVRNVFDLSPPVVYNSFLSFADPSYDFVGRYFWGRIAHKF